MTSLALLASGSAGAMDHDGQDHHPYGGYCQGPRWGWYGAPSQVKTAHDARAHLEKYFEGQDVVIGPVTRRGRWHFQAEIRDRDNALLDRVVIDKRTGRIRSLY